LDSAANHQLRYNPNSQRDFKKRVYCKDEKFEMKDFDPANVKDSDGGYT
jgi:hypothetical protein